MTMSYVWTGMIFFSVVFGMCHGSSQDLSTATLEGAKMAVELSISMTGAICLWSGVMEVMKECGLAEKLAKKMSPLLGKLFPEVSKDVKIMGAISANVSANLLGLGNAATPLGIQAVKELGKKGGGVATPAMCMLIVCNTASIQLIPTTVASLRAATGSEAPFEILPAVWGSSLLSVMVGIVSCHCFRKIWERKERVKGGGKES